MGTALLSVSLVLPRNSLVFGELLLCALVSSSVKLKTIMSRTHYAL